MKFVITSGPYFSELAAIAKKSIPSIVLIILFSSGCNPEKDQPKDSTRPVNILFLTADDLNYNSVGSFGCSIEDITPNIDKLAKKGIKFTNAHVSSAVCQPCRQSLLTGLYPHNNGAEGFEPIDEDVTTLPELLKKAGYLNGLLGKEIHHQPTEKFFWDFIPFITEKDSTWRKGHSRTPSLFYEYSKQFFDLAKQDNKPFFFQANSHDPHRPFTGSANDSAGWGGNPPPVIDKYDSEDIEVLGYLPDIPDVRKEVTQYYNTVARCDQNIGGVLKALEESGLSKNTMIIFMSDHGASFPFAKSQCYLNSTKTPLIVHWPEMRGTEPGFSDQLISGTDIMPTILELMGLTVPENLDGRSFAPLLFDQPYDERSCIFTTYYQIFAKIRYPMRCIQNKEFGYIYNFWSDGQTEMSGDATGGITWNAMNRAARTDPDIAKRVDLYRYRVREEFYDFKNDPDGLKNLIDDPAYATQIDHFRDLMLKEMLKHKDPAYETYRDRNQKGTIENFMEMQRIKARETKKNVMF